MAMLLLQSRPRGIQNQRMIYGPDEFDCELLIPDLDNIVMHGNTPMLPAHVLKMLNEKRERELAAGKRERELATGKDHAKAPVR
jgi:hypothetical protein